MSVRPSRRSSGDQGVAGLLGVPGLEASGAEVSGGAGDELVVVDEVPSRPGRVREVELGQGSEIGELRHRQGVPRGDGDVVRAHSRPAPERRGIVEAGRVGESAVLHPVAGGRRRECVGEALEAPGRCLGDRVRGVVRGDHQEAGESLVDRPLLAGEHRDLAGGLRGSEVADRDQAVGRKALDRCQGGHDLRSAGGRQSGVRVLGSEDPSRVGVGDDPRLRLGGGGGRARGRRRRSDRRRNRDGEGGERDDGANSDHGVRQARRLGPELGASAGGIRRELGRPPPGSRARMGA